MAANGISTLPTKEARQIAKLDLAALKRGQSYDRDLLPTKYVGNTVVNNPNIGGLQPGRPWLTGSVNYIMRIRNAPGGNVITTCNEGDSIYIEVEWANLTVPGGVNSYLVLGGVNIENADLQTFGPPNALDPIVWGADTVPASAGTTGANLTVVADDTTEGNETLTWKWYLNGNVVASASCTIVDTSQTPLPYEIVPSATSMNEGGTGITFTINTTGLADNSQVIWWIDGIGSVVDPTWTNRFVEGVNNGTVTIISNTASFTLTASSNNNIGDGAVFSIWISSTLFQGQANSGDITINDTSQPPAGNTLGPYNSAFEGGSPGTVYFLISTYPDITTVPIGAQMTGTIFPNPAIPVTITSSYAWVNPLYWSLNYSAIPPGTANTTTADTFTITW